MDKKEFIETACELLRDFCIKIYREGFKDGAKSVQKVDLKNHDDSKRGE